MPFALSGQTGTLASLAAFLQALVLVYLVLAIFVAGVALGRRGAIR